MSLVLNMRKAKFNQDDYKPTPDEIDVSQAVLNRIRQNTIKVRISPVTT
jgi:hypothetical protein